MKFLFKFLTFGAVILTFVGQQASLAQFNSNESLAVLYSGKNYSGASYRLTLEEQFASIQQLDSTGLWPSLEYMVGSIEIHGDVVLLLWNDSDFQGNVMKISQSVSDIRRIRNRPIGSLKLTSSARTNVSSSIPSSPQRRGPQVSNSGEVRIYEETGFNGNSLSFNRYEIVGDLNRISGASRKWNNRISSIYIKGDFSIVIFKDAHFKGHSLRIDESVSNLRDLRRRDPNKKKWNDSVSSFEVISKDGESLYASGQPRYAGTIFEDDNFQGRYSPLYDGQAISNLKNEGMTDKISSVMVEHSYKIILYKDTNYRGESITLDLHQPSLNSFPGNWNDEASSLKVVRDR